jgi:hypothetical protein
VRRLLVTANVPGSPILVTLMMEVLHSSKTLVLTRAAQRNVPEDDILHSHHCENLETCQFSLIVDIRNIYLVSDLFICLETCDACEESVIHFL